MISVIKLNCISGKSAYETLWDTEESVAVWEEEK